MDGDVLMRICIARLQNFQLTGIQIAAGGICFFIEPLNDASDSILLGFLGNLTITGSGHYSGIIVAFFEILTAYAFIYLFNQTVVYKNLNVHEKQKSKLLHIVSLCNVTVNNNN